MATTWLADSFGDVPVVTGTFQGRTRIEAPVWVRNADASGAKYAFAIGSSGETLDRRVAFSNVRIADLHSKDRFGAGIGINPSAQGAELYLVNVLIEPNWPNWDGYESTNYDGIVLDGALAIYAQTMTIRNWNADSAIDNKARTSQFADLHILGNGHRPIRYWQPGPHYLVDTTIQKPDGGTMIWFKDCGTVELRIFGSSFNGRSRLSDEMIQCDVGEAPDIAYLSEDPRSTGEMLPMFVACDG
ncbi:MAG: hypothetical protein QNJ44_05560 [Rhodobacter sp.]|nr:hypothetical protein [Rhodobacter sp.]